MNMISTQRSIYTKEHIPPPYTAKDLIKLSLLPSSEGGKNTSAIISLKNPKRAKSYHSRTFPITPAIVCPVEFTIFAKSLFCSIVLK